MKGAPVIGEIVADPESGPACRNGRKRSALETPTYCSGTLGSDEGAVSAGGAPDSGTTGGTKVSPTG